MCIWRTFMLRHSIFRSHCWVFFSEALFSPSVFNSVCRFFRISSWTNELQSLSVSVSICAVYVFGFLNRICTVIVFALAAYAYADVVVAPLFIIILSSSFFGYFQLSLQRMHTHTDSLMQSFIALLSFSFIHLKSLWPKVENHANKSEQNTMLSDSMLFAIALDFTVTISHSRSAFDNFQLKTFAQDELIPFIIYLSVVLAFRQDVINSAYELLTNFELVE